MWLSFRLILAAGVIVVGSFLLLVVASGLALVRADVEQLDADLASLIVADYSADPQGARFSPLSGDIVDVARQDESTLQETASGIQIVPVFHQTAPATGEPGASPTPTVGPGQAPPTS